jgi:hypothetical protein
MRGIPGPPSDELGKPVDSAQLQSMLTDGTVANERSTWLPGFLEGKSRSWFLSMAIWHTAEHLLGGVVLRETGVGNPGGPLSPIILLGLSSLLGQLLP